MASPTKGLNWLHITAVLFSALIFVPDRILAGEVTGHVLINSEPADHAVVYLQTPDGQPIPSTPDAKTIRQENLRFKPDFLAVPAGTTIRFENNDDEIHNVYSKTAAARFDTGGILPHTAKKIVLKEPGIASLRCRTHQNMRGLVFVAPSPYFSVTDRLGQFEIQNIPSGSYRIEVWHSQLTAEESARGGQRLELGTEQKVVQLDLNAKAGRGVELTEGMGRDWAATVDRIRAGLDRAILQWGKNGATAAAATVMSTSSNEYGESGLRDAISQVFGKARAEEHEKRFDAFRKQVQGIGGTEPTTEAALRHVADLLIDGLTADTKKITAP